MKNALIQAGIHLEVSIVNEVQVEEFVLDDDRTLEFVDLWGDDMDYMLDETYVPFILACIIMLCMTKNLNTTNFQKWFSRRVKTFSGSLGDIYASKNIEDNQFPQLVNLNALQMFASANHPARKAIYQEIVTLADQRKSFISLGYAEIHHMLSGHEMQHLILIDKYIIEEHPELIDTFITRGLMPRFGTALNKLAEFLPEEMMYAKLIADKDECAALNRKIFDEAATVATTIAAIKNPTFENYYQNNDSGHEKLQNLVKEYINMRRNLVPIATGEKDITSMGDIERAEYFNRALDTLKKRYLDENKVQEGSLQIIIPIGDINERRA